MKGCIGYATWDDCDRCANDDYYEGCIIGDATRFYFDEEELCIYCLDFKERDEET